MSRDTARISFLALRTSIHCWESRSSISRVEWPGLKPNWRSEIKPLEKRKDLMFEAMVNSITLLMIGRRLIDLQLQGSVFAPFYAGQWCLLLSKQMADDLEQMRGWREQTEGEQEQKSWFLGHVGWFHLDRLQNQRWGLTAKSPLCQKKRTQSPGTVGCDWVRWVQKVMGFEHKI